MKKQHKKQLAGKGYWDWEKIGKGEKSLLDGKPVHNDPLLTPKMK